MGALDDKPEAPGPCEPMVFFQKLACMGAKLCVLGTCHHT
jgi:hypothetical protein